MHCDGSVWTDPLDELLEELASAAPGSSMDRLLDATAKAPIPRHLQEKGLLSGDLERRLRAWPLVAAAAIGREVRCPMKPFGVWSFPLPLAELLLAAGHRIVGLAGPPGSGKSTLASLIITCLGALEPGFRGLAVSLDDLYLSRAERQARGLSFRAQPGSHDLQAGQRLLRATRSGDTKLHVPRFDHARDEPLTPEQLDGPVQLLLLEGWFVGMRAYGYEVLADQLDSLIYLDCPTELARTRRLDRERQIREHSKSRLGLSEEAMEQFWDEILGPGIDRFSRPVMRHAGLVIRLDSEGRIADVSSRTRGNE